MSDQTESATPPSSTLTRPTTLQLMGSTPLRDAFRGRLTGRLDIAGACARASLPDMLTRKVLHTVRATRLWRVEKAEVGAELIAHFRDGLDSGRTPDELIASFGDPAVAARLIRQTKKHARPFPWKVWLLAWKSVGAILLLCVVAYAFLFVRFHWGRTVLTTNSLAKLNEPVHAIPTDERAWTRYKAAILASSRLPDEFSDPLAQWPLVPKDSPFRPAALAYLNQNAAALEQLHAAAAMPHLGYLLADYVRPDDPWYDPAQPQPSWHRPEWKDNPPLIGVLLPSLGEFRRFAHVLMFDSLLAREAGDASRLGRNIQTTIAMAEHTRDLPFIISDLVALALMARACDEVNATLHETPDLLSDEQLIALAHTLSAFPKDHAPIIRFESEALGFEDVLQRVYTDDGRGNGHVSVAGNRLMQLLNPSHESTLGEAALGPVATAIMADRASMKREYEEILSAAVTAARTPMWQWTSDPDSIFESREKDLVWRHRYALIGDMMSAVGRTSLAQHRFTQTRGATLTTIALTLAKRRTGAYPTSLEALTPELLPAIPPDIFDGRPIRYALVDGSPVVYSIGVDRKDDGGRRAGNPYSGQISDWKSPEDAASMLSSSIGRDVIDGDWVLFPPLPPMPPPSDGDDMPEAGPRSKGANNPDPQ